MCSLEVLLHFAHAQAKFQSVDLAGELTAYQGDQKARTDALEQAHPTLLADFGVASEVAASRIRRCRKTIAGSELWWEQ